MVFKQCKKPLDYEEFKRLESIKFLEGHNRKEGAFGSFTKDIGQDGKKKFGGFKVNYDQTSDVESNGQKLSASNHHLLSLAHSPDLIGLFFSILNQFTNTASFISNGKLITINNTESFELKGGNFIAKIICGFINWLGHLMSDWAGSKSSAEKGNRGRGIPMPFYNLFQLCNFGSFGKDKQTFAVITTKVFESGYDFRHGMAMAIPVAITEILTRIMYVLKARFYHKKEWEKCMPNGNIPEVRRMLCVGHGSLCLLDIGDAALRSGNPAANPVMFLARTNLIGFARFSHLALKEMKAWLNKGALDIESIDDYLDKEFKQLLVR